MSDAKELAIIINSTTSKCISGRIKRLNEDYNSMDSQLRVKVQAGKSSSAHWNVPWKTGKMAQTEIKMI